MLPLVSTSWRAIGAGFVEAPVAFGPSPTNGSWNDSKREGIIHVIKAVGVDQTMTTKVPDVEIVRHVPVGSLFHDL
jgi:hypothetical protein